jgi:hypothetical protein
MMPSISVPALGEAVDFSGRDSIFCNRPSSFFDALDQFPVLFAIALFAPWCRPLGKTAENDA